MRRAGQVMIQRWFQLTERARLTAHRRSNAGQSGFHAQIAGRCIRLFQGLLFLLEFFENFSILIFWSLFEGAGKLEEKNKLDCLDLFLLVDWWVEIGG